MAKSSKMINVRGLDDKNDSDPCFRYKMQALKLEKQKTKDVILNINDIGDNLSRDPKMLVEFLKKKFGTQMKYSATLNKIEIKGISQIDLQKAIYEFIEYFVLCPTCRNPETILRKKKENLYISCKACSHDEQIKMTNKIVSNTSDNIIKLIK